MTTFVGKEIKRKNGQPFSTGNMEETVLHEIVSPVNGKMRLYITPIKFINEEYAEVINKGPIRLKPLTKPRQMNWEEALV